MNKAHCPVCKKEVVIDLKKDFCICKECKTCLSLELAYQDKPKFNEPWKPREDEKYYYITINGDIESYVHTCLIDFREDSNYFKTEKETKKQAKKEYLNRKLEAFSKANGGDEIDWNNPDQQKWVVAYDNINKNFKAFDFLITRHISETYFISKDVAQEAIRRYKDLLEEVRNG